MLVLAFGIYLASDGHRWGDPFVSIGIAAIAIIAVVGGGVVVPALRQLAALDPASAEYERVYRRYMASETFLGAVVLRDDLRNGGQTVLMTVGSLSCPLPSC